MPLKIAVPNKGRLMEETLELLRDVGLRVPRQTDRTLIATAANVPPPRKNTSRDQLIWQDSIVRT